MKIGALVHMYPPYHNAGAEHMLHAMLKYFVAQGHECVVCVDFKHNAHFTKFKPYELDGVRVSMDKRILNKVDVLLTHLDCTEDAEDMAVARHIPLAQIFHNELRPQMVKHCDLGIYNTQWIADLTPIDAPSIVVRPPVWRDDYLVKPQGQFITLINLQKNKGSDMFYRLAYEMPDLQFLGVKGSYGIQEPAPDLPNLTILENQKDIRGVYLNTKILLMPSGYESYGRCAIEAAVSGIPTIAHPTQGLREALGDAGVYPLPDSPSWVCAVRYTLDRYPALSAAAKRRANSLDPDSEMRRCLAALVQTVDNYS